MSDFCLMGPVGAEYSPYSDEKFESLIASELIHECDIDVLAFWKYNVKVMNQIGTLTAYGTAYRDEYVATAVNTLKSGFALYYTKAPLESSVEFASPVLDPTLTCPYQHEPNLFYFNTYQFSIHKGKGYICDPFMGIGGTITADKSSLVVEYGSFDTFHYRYEYTCLETFY